MRSRHHRPPDRGDPKPWRRAQRVLPHQRLSIFATRLVLSQRRSLGAYAPQSCFTGSGIYVAVNLRGVTASDGIVISPTAPCDALPIVRRCGNRHSSSITTTHSPITISHQDKLEALRRLDQFRHWSSLDERRYCLSCGKVITGRQIILSGGTRGHGPLRVECPTRGCIATPIDWAIPPDGVREVIEREETVPPRQTRNVLKNGREQLLTKWLSQRLRGLRFPKISRGGI